MPRTNDDEQKKYMAKDQAFYLCVGAYLKFRLPRIHGDVPVISDTP